MWHEELPENDPDLQFKNGYLKTLAALETRQEIIQELNQKAAELAKEQWSVHKAQNKRCLAVNFFALTNSNILPLRLNSEFFFIKKHKK